METNQKGAKEEVDTDCPESVEDTESETTSGFCCINFSLEKELECSNRSGEHRWFRKRRKYKEP